MLPGFAREACFDARPPPRAVPRASEKRALLGPLLLRLLGHELLSAQMTPGGFPQFLIMLSDRLRVVATCLSRPRRVSTFSSLLPFPAVHVGAIGAIA